LVDPVLVLGDELLNVEPGGEARATATVRNVGELVEQYRLEVLGDAARWSQVVPRQISVLPGGSEEKTVVVVFRPPAPPVTVAGNVPFGLRCVSLEAPDRCAVVEGDLVIGAVVGLAARLETVKPAGRWTGRYQVVLDNTGSVPVRLRLAAEDSRRVLRFAVAPPEVTVEPGGSATAYVSVQPRQPALRGKPATHGFSVGYQAVEGDQRGELAGVFEQRPILSKGVMAACLLLLGVAAVGVALLLRAGGGAALPDEQDPVPPPPIALTAATILDDGSVQLVWQSSPYAISYLVQQLLPDGSVGDSKEVADRDQSALTWSELAPGEHCFQVVAVGQGGRSEPSQPMCAAVPTPQPTTSAPPSGPPTTAPPTAPPSSPPPGADPVQGAYYVVYVPPTAVDDPPTQGQADEDTARLQQAGAQPVLINSLQSQRLPDGPNGAGLWVILQDGFATYDDAFAECEAHRDVAPQCRVAE
jgi:hypothetical protein